MTVSLQTITNKENSIVFRMVKDKQFVKVLNNSLMSIF